MSTVVLTPSVTSVNGDYILPASKSISNRLLIINALSQNRVAINHLSNADDTITLKRCIQEQGTVIHAGSGGTTARFLLALLSSKCGEWILDANPQMRLRSIKSLVDALIFLGAEIKYLENVGYLPVRINGKPLESRKLNIDSQISSQFVSAIMLIAPYLTNGLDITIDKGFVSQSYINMTRILMTQCGAEVQGTIGSLSIENKKYVECEITVEPDWSAAAFAYQLAVLSNDPQIFMPLLKPSILQGDSIVADLFHNLQVKTVFTENGAMLIKGHVYTPPLKINVSAYPDIAPSLIVTCAALGIKAMVTGINHLRYKESNRIDALRINLEKMGVSITLGNNCLYIEGEIKVNEYTIETFSDHRIAMAFAPLVLKGFKLEIKESECVSKSFPDFWNQLLNIGIKVDKYL